MDSLVSWLKKSGFGRTLPLRLLLMVDWSMVDLSVLRYGIDCWPWRLYNRTGWIPPLLWVLLPPRL